MVKHTSADLHTLPYNAVTGHAAALEVSASKSSLLMQGTHKACRHKDGLLMRATLGSGLCACCKWSCTAHARDAAIAQRACCIVQGGWGRRCTRASLTIQSRLAEDSLLAELMRDISDSTSDWMCMVPEMVEAIPVRYVSLIFI